MKKILVVSLMLLLLSNSLVACSTSSLNNNNGLLSDEDKFRKMKIDYIAEDGTVEYDFFDNWDAFSVNVLHAIKTAKKMDGTIDEGEPNYKVKVWVYNGETKTFNIWLGEESGMLSLETDPSTAYELTEESFKELSDGFHRYFE